MGDNLKKWVNVLPSLVSSPSPHEKESLAVGWVEASVEIYVAMPELPSQLVSRHLHINLNMKILKLTL